MRRFGRVLTVGALIGLAWLVASSFRKPAAYDPSATSDVPTMPDLAAAPVEPRPPEFEFAGRIEAVDEPAAPEIAAQARADEPPLLAATYPGATDGQAASANPRPPWYSESSPPRIASAIEAAPPQAIRNLAAPSARSAIATHRIVDGDTLSSLAERYLGDGSRYLEIYQYNRDVLRGPDLLPINAELRIPPPDAPQVAPLGPPAASPPTTGETEPELSSATNLVPVPRTAPPRASSGEVRAAPRSYTVQPNDTLVTIARQVYGDGRRHETIFQANRAQMRHPQDLRPGVVLVIP